jgi:hypothetical protein
MKKCVINYFRVHGITKEDKFEWLSANKGDRFKNIPFDHFIPEKTVIG